MFLLLVLGTRVSWPSPGDGHVANRPALAQPPASEQNWYSVAALGTHCGWARHGIQRIDSTPLVRARVVGEYELRMSLAVGAQTRAYARSSRFIFDGVTPFLLLEAEFSNQVTESAKTLSNWLVRVMRRGEEYIAVKREGELSSEIRLGALDFTLSDRLAIRTWLDSLPQVGDRLVSREFDSETLAVQPTEYTVVRRSAPQESTLTAAWVDLVMNAPSRQSEFRFDGYRVSPLTLRDGDITLTLASEIDAKSATLPAQLAGVFGDVSIDRAIGDTGSLASLTLWLSGVRGSDVPEGRFQSTLFDPNRSAFRLVLADRIERTPVVDPAEEKRALELSGRYGGATGEIAKLAGQAVEGVVDREERVERIRTIVRSLLKYQLIPGDATIDDILTFRRGDCSEFALLFTALCRAAGIPAREIAGLVYMGDESRAFGLHRWAEVVIRDRWVPVDPCQRSGPFDLGHIALSYEQPPAPHLPGFEKAQLVFVRSERR